MQRNLFILLVVYIFINFSHAWINPIFDYVKDKTYCKLKECCNDNYIPRNITKLEEDLKSHLFGQHIVIQQVIPALTAHFNKDVASKKPLVFSFHGVPGTGKNYVAHFIAKSLYKNGLDSRFVHYFNGLSSFPVQDKSEEYRVQIHNTVKRGLSECPHSMFIFDEVNRMPKGIFESLTSLVNYQYFRKGPDSTQAIFLFIANTAGKEIGLHLNSLMISGKSREETKLSDFERILINGAYNLEGGMQKATLIEEQVVDHYIPFLPLEKEHVYKCIQVEFRLWGKSPNSKVIENIISEAIAFETKAGLFATSGCKRLDKKVAVAAKLLYSSKPVARISVREEL